VPRLAAQDDLMATCRERAAAAQQAGQMAVRGEDGWLFLVSELRHYSAGKFWGEDAAGVSRATKPKYADPLPAILDFHEQLKTAGIDLWLVPVPPKIAVYPDKLFPDATPSPRVDNAHFEFYDLLRESGVTIVDLLPEFLAAREEYRRDVYCRQDSHWSGLAIEIAARHLGERIKKQPWAGDLRNTTSRADRRRVTLSGDLWVSLAAADLPCEELELVFVRDPDGQPLGTDEASPVLLIGDSHTLVFHGGGDMHATGAGLSDLLAHRLQSGVDLIGVRGSGATPSRINLMRRNRSRAGYLAGKKLVIWCFSAREFTESDGWRKVPMGL